VLLAVGRAGGGVVIGDLQGVVLLLVGSVGYSRYLLPSSRVIM